MPASRRQALSFNFGSQSRTDRGQLETFMATELGELYSYSNPGTNLLGHRVRAKKRALENPRNSERFQKEVRGKRQE